jgi:hypothetical protein
VSGSNGFVALMQPVATKRTGREARRRREAMATLFAVKMQVV